MYNSDIPSRAELPTTRQLIRSTILAILAAIAILVTVVLPAEYAIDPTGIGRVLRLTEMGEIKQQLAAEAAADRLRDQQNAPAPQPRSGLFGGTFASLFISTAHATERTILAQATPARSDQTVITLEPTQGVEWKMTMSRGAQVQYSWSATGPVNYDMHGTRAGGAESSYRNARGVTSDQGTLTAGFDGSHGWFFRNRGRTAVTITLRTEGAYANLRRMP